MNVNRIALSALFVGLLAIVPAFSQNAPAPEPAAATLPPAHIGVVRLDKLLNDLQEGKDIKAKLESDINALKLDQQAHETELRSLLQNRDNSLKPGSPQYDDATEQLFKKQLEFKEDLELRNGEMGRNHNKAIKALYDKIEAACGDIAKSKGLDLVITQIKSDFPPNSSDASPEEVKNVLQQFMQQRTLIYVAPNLDITGDVITAMDAAYKASGK